MQIAPSRWTLYYEIFHAVVRDDEILPSHENDTVSSSINRRYRVDEVSLIRIFFFLSRLCGVFFFNTIILHKRPLSTYA